MQKSVIFNSFLPKTVRAWNDLPNELKSATTLDSFKERLNRSVKKTPKHFYTGQRSLQIYHSRLRTKCSSLNSHLHSKNIIEDPHCLCGAIEDTNHYLLQCPLYSGHRQKMIEDLDQILHEEVALNTLLYGSNSKNYNLNTSIFK